MSVYRGTHIRNIRDFLACLEVHVLDARRGLPLRCPDLHFAADPHDFDPLFVTLVDNLNYLGRRCTQALQLMCGPQIGHLEEAV